MKLQRYTVIVGVRGAEAHLLTPEVLYNALIRALGRVLPSHELALAVADGDTSTQKPPHDSDPLWPAKAHEAVSAAILAPLTPREIRKGRADVKRIRSEWRG